MTCTTAANGPDPDPAEPAAGASAEDLGCGAHAGSDASAIMALLELAAALLKALGRWGALAASEARVARASVPLLLGAALAPVLLGVSLWVVLVALVGWLLFYITLSPAIALGVLAGVHCVVMLLVWLGMRHVMRQATLPHSRAELRALLATAQCARCQAEPRAQPGASGVPPTAQPRAQQRRTVP